MLSRSAARRIRPASHRRGCAGDDGPLHIAPNQIGILFSAALFGLMLGAFGLGPIADRYGRRWVLIRSTGSFGVFTLCTAIAGTLQQVLLFRFFAGVGSGGAMPSFISLAAVYPAVKPAGGDWAAMDRVSARRGDGRIACIAADRRGWLAVVVLHWRRPAGLSVDRVDLRTARFDRVPGHAEGRRPGDSGSVGPDPTDYSCCVRLSIRHRWRKDQGVPVWQLFSAGRGRGTVLLSASYFVTFMILATSGAWTPTLLQREGIPGARSSVAVALFALGSVFGRHSPGFW